MGWFSTGFGFGLCGVILKDRRFWSCFDLLGWTWVSLGFVCFALVELFGLYAD